MATRNPLRNIRQKRNSDLFITAIIPVVDEPANVWKKTLESLEIALKPFNDSQVIVVANGNNGKDNIELARKHGFNVIKLGMASKRRAIEAGVAKAKGDVTIILDSDTSVTPDSIIELTSVFADKSVGGATPKHIIDGRDRNLMKRISDWMEDIRFQEVVRGQSSTGAVSCLPGRLLAVRTDLLKSIVPSLVSQRFMGKACVSGDDRFITSEILKKGYKTVFVPTSVVSTEAPATLKGFIFQRLRWSRTSFRETLRSISWTLKHPYMTFTVFTTLLMRWFFAVVLAFGIATWAGIIDRSHYLHLPIWLIVVGTIIGFLLSGFFRQLRHLIKYPQDFVYLPIFLFVTTFILTPVEWWGNLTVRESGWMTRDTS